MGSVYGITGSTTLTANTANQIIFGVVSGSATTDGVIVWLDVTMDAATPASGVKCELFRATGGIPTLTQYTTINRMNAAAQNTASGMASAWVPPITSTPTGLIVTRTWYLPPTGGALLQWPLSREDYLISGTTVWTGLKVSTPAGVAPDLGFNFMWNE